MESPRIWSRVQDKVARILVLHGTQVHLLKVTGIAMTLKGKVQKVVTALEMGASPEEAGGKVVATLDAREVAKAELSPGDSSLTLHGPGEKAAKLVSGIDILAHLIQPESVLIGIEDNKPEAIAAVRAALGERPYVLKVFPTKYPSGGEKQLIQILTGREVPSGGLPADIGMLCQNVGTCVAIHDAVVLGRPLISRERSRSAQERAT